TTFHKYFTWPDGTPVETINGRNRHWGVSPWGHFGFSHWPDGRGYAEFLASWFATGKLDSKTIGRIAQSALYYHEGPTNRAGAPAVAVLHPPDESAGRNPQDRPMDGVSERPDRHTDRQSVHPRSPGAPEHLPPGARPDHHGGQFEKPARTGYLPRKA